MTDFLLLEKINRLNYSIKRPRLLYRKGTMAGGIFQPYMSFAEYTRAKFLHGAEVKTPVAVRFSRAAGETGSADSLRDTRGFAVRFFTEEGEYDLLGHNFPVFFIDDEKDFPQWIESMLPIPDGLPDRNAYWRFFGEHPEAVGLIMRLFSDEGTIKSYRKMSGYSIGTYKWVNQRGHIHFVRYRWVPLKSGEVWDVDSTGISNQEAEFLAGFEPDCAARDLYDALEEGIFPVYELQIQIITAEQGREWGFDWLRNTIFWPQDRAPYIRAGVMRLTEKLAEQQMGAFCFAPSHLVPGIEWGNTEFLEVMDYILKGDGRLRGGRV